MFVDGKLEPRQYQANDGQMRWSFDVTLSEFEFVGSSRDQQEGGFQQGGGGYQHGGQPQQRNQNQGGYQGNQNQGNPPNDDDYDMSNIDDVPF